MKIYLTSQLANLYQGRPLNMERREWMINWVAGSTGCKRRISCLSVPIFLPSPNRSVNPLESIDVIYRQDDVWR